MTMVLRIVSGLLGAILGAVVVVVLALVGDGIEFIPMSRFLLPLTFGSGIGFVVGVVFHNVTRSLFSFLVGRFGE